MPVGVNRIRWVASTLAVALSSFAMALGALWIASGLEHRPFVTTALRWDTDWYYVISQGGYVSTLPTTSTQYTALRPAFFPGLPLLEHVVHAGIGGPPVATTLLVGALGLIASCLLLRALAARHFDEGAAWRATVLFAFFPGAYVFVMAYSEALFVPLALLAFYALGRRWYLLAGLATAVATGTLVLGVALVAALVIAGGREILAAARNRRPPPRSVLAAAVAAPIIGMAGLVGYMVYLHAKTGTAFAFTTAERVGWNNHVSLTQPYDAVRSFVLHPFATFSAPWITVDASGVVVLIACLFFLVVRGLHRVPVEELLYAGLILLAWLFTSNTGAWFRFLLSAFPVVVLLAEWLKGRWYVVVMCACAALLCFLIILFGSVVTFSP